MSVSPIFITNAFGLGLMERHLLSTKTCKPLISSWCTMVKEVGSQWAPVPKVRSGWGALRVVVEPQYRVMGLRELP